MALTAWEAVKVLGRTVEELGTKGEDFEDNNPEENYKPTVADITQLVVAIARDLGVEILD